MCELLKVSRSGYYKWLRAEKSKAQKKKESLMHLIYKLFHEFHGVYGSPRIYAELKKKDITISEKTVARYMKEMGLRATPEERYVITTDSNHSQPIYPNLIGRNFNPEKPDRVWVSDITYIWTREGWLYLASIIDLFSRKVIGWNLADRLTKELPLTALNRALKFRDPSAKLIHHSDRGSQYASIDYTNILKENKIQISMSRKGNCYDNACAEAFHATIKKELIYRNRFETREEAKLAVWSYITSFYNEKRSHSTLGYISPNEYERAYRKTKDIKQNKG